MNKANRDALFRMFKKEVHDKSRYIDPSNNQDWYSLTLGWALGKGLKPSEAHALALHIRLRLARLIE